MPPWPNPNADANTNANANPKPNQQAVHAAVACRNSPVRARAIAINTTADDWRNVTALMGPGAPANTDGVMAGGEISIAAGSEVLMWFEREP